jgi:hypothetical protein
VIEVIAEYYSSALVIEPEIWNNNLNKFSVCNMIFDTGANMTSIDMKIANRAGYKTFKSSTGFVTGIGGTTPSKYAIIPKFRLSGIDFGPMCVNVLDFPENYGVTAVLGLNFIREFSIAIDFNDSGGVIKFKPTFDINNIFDLNSFNLLNSRFGIFTIKENNT